MTSSFFLLRRPPWIRSGLAVALILSAAIVSRRYGCGEEWPIAYLFAVAGVQLPSAALSLGLALVAAIRCGWREALGEAVVCVLMLLAIVAAVAAALFLEPGACE